MFVDSWGSGWELIPTDSRIWHPTAYWIQILCMFLSHSLLEYYWIGPISNFSLGFSSIGFSCYFAGGRWDRVKIFFTDSLKEILPQVSKWPVGCCSQYEKIHFFPQRHTPSVKVDYNYSWIYWGNLHPFTLFWIPVAEASLIVFYFCRNLGHWEVLTVCKSMNSDWTSNFLHSLLPTMFMIKYLSSTTLKENWTVWYIESGKHMTLWMTNRDYLFSIVQWDYLRTKRNLFIQLCWLISVSSSTSICSVIHQSP